MSHNQQQSDQPLRKVSILGAGAWGTTLAILAANAGHQVTLVSHREESRAHMESARQHPTSLPGVGIPDHIRLRSVGDPGLDDAEVVVVAVPTQKLRASIQPLANDLRGKTIVSVVKGLELESNMRPSQVIRSVMGDSTPVAVLSGPNLSSEIARGLPATTVIASNEIMLAEDLVGIFHTRLFRVYVSEDVVGVELGGALKNIIAIGAGIADGLGAGDNAKAAFMTRGITEIARLGVACGAQPLTFAGLSGIGDLIATCSSPASRNHQVGVALSAGLTLPAILDSMQEVAEGVPTTRAARELGTLHMVELPIVEQIYRVLFEGILPAEAITRLMERDPAHEQSQFAG